MPAISSNSLVPLYGFFSISDQLTFPRAKLHSLRLPTSDANGFGPSPNIGTIAFDTHLELLWVGDCHVSSSLRPLRRFGGVPDK